MRKSMALAGMLVAGVLIAQTSHAQTTQGNVDGVVEDGTGAVTLRGWACKVSETLPSARTVTLKLYVGGEAGNGGVELGTYTVDQPSEQAINDICRNAYRYNRFTIGLSIAMRQQYGGQRLYVYADTFNHSARFQLLPGSGQPMVPQAPAVSNAVYYIHTDRLGSNVIMTDEKANVVAKTDYKAYGAASDHQAKNEAPGYTGHYEDPLTGLTYMQQRYYDADLGRFISIDPVAPRPGDVFNYNRYAYANNNPLLFVDPNGADTTKFQPVQVWGSYSVGRWNMTFYYEDFGTGGFRIPSMRASFEGGGSSYTLKPVKVTADRPADPDVPIDALQSVQSWYCTPGAASVAGGAVGGTVAGALTGAVNLRGNPYGILSAALIGGAAGGGARVLANRIAAHGGEPSASTFSSMLSSAVVDRAPGAYFINGAASFVGSKMEMRQGDISKMAGRTAPYVIGATATTYSALGNGALVAGPMIGLAGGLMDYSAEAGWNNFCGN